MNSQNDNLPNQILSANDLYNINSEVTGRMPFLREHQLLQSVEAEHLPLRVVRFNQAITVKQHELARC